jgi:hypothetical protein
MTSDDSGATPSLTECLTDAQMHFSRLPTEPRMRVQDLFVVPRRLTFGQWAHRGYLELRWYLRGMPTDVCHYCDAPGRQVLCVGCEALTVVFASIPAAWAEAWTRAVAHVRRTRPATAALLAKLAPVSSTGGFFVLAPVPLSDTPPLPPLSDFEPAPDEADDAILAAWRALRAIRAPILEVDIRASAAWFTQESRHAD